MRADLICLLLMHCEVFVCEASSDSDAEKAVPMSHLLGSWTLSFARASAPHFCFFFRVCLGFELAPYVRGRRPRNSAAPFRKFMSRVKWQNFRHNLGSPLPP